MAWNGVNELWFGVSSTFQCRASTLAHVCRVRQQQHLILASIFNYLQGFYILVLMYLGYFLYFSLPSKAVAALLHRVRQQLNSSVYFSQIHILFQLSCKHVVACWVAL